MFKVLVETRAEQLFTGMRLIGRETARKPERSGVLHFTTAYFPLSSGVCPGSVSHTERRAMQDFASSSDEGYIQDWKVNLTVLPSVLRLSGMQEILQLLTQHGVIFPVPPPREKMIKIFEETVVKHGIVTGAQVRAIFGRSSLRQVE